MVLIPVSYTHLTRLREQAFLNAGANIILTDKRTDDYKTVTMCYEGGIKSYVEFLNKERGSEVINNDVIYLSAVSGDSTAEVAMQYNLDYSNLIMSFANNIHTVDGLSLIHISCTFRVVMWYYCIITHPCLCSGASPVDKMLNYLIYYKIQKEVRP